ncbi:MAG: four-helix bundle copper-binding protein [Thalassobius sp.]|nr:four-helix bundle copper-binding protein [Thalassovita sp.]
MKNQLIKSLTDCIEACGNCAASCLREFNVKDMTDCIQTDVDCQEICTTTLAFITRGSSNSETLLKACIEICKSCEKECRNHEMDHCQHCADACRACYEACEANLSVAA